MYCVSAADVSRVVPSQFARYKMPECELTYTMWLL